MQCTGSKVKKTSFGLDNTNVLQYTVNYYHQSAHTGILMIKILKILVICYKSNQLLVHHFLFQGLIYFKINIFLSKIIYHCQAFFLLHCVLCKKNVWGQNIFHFIWLVNKIESLHAPKSFRSLYFKSEAFS